jgi:hypothetical protein
MPWTTFDEGRTIANDGPWGGVIACDAYHPRGARLTVELRIRFAGVKVTLRLFGRIEQVRHFERLADAEEWYERAAAALGEALDQEPAVGDPDVRPKAVQAPRALSNALAAVAGDE